MVSMMHYTNDEQNGADEEAEAIKAIEELITEFGKRGFLAAFLQSTAATDLNDFGTNATREVAQVIIRNVAFSKNPQLEAEIIALASGVILGEKDNITRIAEKHGLTKQAVSKRVIKFCEQNGLPPSGFMRSKKDRETYRKTNRPRMW